MFTETYHGRSFLTSIQTHTVFCVSPFTCFILEFQTYRHIRDLIHVLQADPSMDHPKPPVTTWVSGEANNGINHFLANLQTLQTIFRMVDPLAATRLSNVTTAPDNVIQATKR